MSSNPDNGRLAKAFWYLEWHYIAGAVMEVFRENQRLEEADKDAIKASADSWCICEPLRQDVYQRARRNWLARTKEPVTTWPYNVDYTALVYFKFRKRNPEELKAFEQEIQRASGTPPSWF
jgi:hypothetical protein